MTADGVAERAVEVVNRAGMHARPAADLVKLAAAFQSDISVAKDGLEVNGKSIMGVLMLAAECGSTLVIRAQGDDAADAVSALCDLVASGFEDLEA